MPGRITSMQEWNNKRQQEVSSSVDSVISQRQGVTVSQRVVDNTNTQYHEFLKRETPHRRPLVDKPPSTFSHLKTRAKRRQMRKERRQAIERENARLQRRLQVRAEWCAQPQCNTVMVPQLTLGWV